MIAAGVLVDPRRAAEFAPGDHRHVVEQAALLEVFDQSRQALIELRAVIAHQVEILRVAVPPAIRQRDDTHTRLDQAASQSKCSFTVGAPSN
jgi:hypothetical protein